LSGNRIELNRIEIAQEAKSELRKEREEEAVRGRAMEREAAGARVWVQDDRRAWVRGVVEQRDFDEQRGKYVFHVRKENLDGSEDSASDSDEDPAAQQQQEAGVKIESESAELSKLEQLYLCNTFEDGRTLADIQDLTWLTHLHEPSILQSLHDRFKQDAIYTNTGPILLAVNPFKQLKLYTPEVLESYYSAGLLKSQGLEAPELVPHVYATGDAAYRNMIDAEDDKLRNQSILVSGESGAGKTESTKFIMQYLATVAKDENASEGQKIADMVLQSNPILEAFGNARTNRNDNSSRFGKFIEMQFNDHGHLVGARIATYLLEKVRLAKQGPGERNFHVFYQLCRGASHDQLEEWHVPALEACGITNQSGCLDRQDEVNDDDQFQRMCKAMEIMGFPEEERAVLMRTVSVVMNLGNLIFTGADEHVTAAGEEDEAAVLDELASAEAVSKCVELLGVSKEELSMALTSRKIKVGIEWISKKLSIDEAADARDALAKTVYSRMFDYVVRRVNESIQVKVSTKTNCIGVLDIFGFEVFESNSFEQLCINYANETLQQQFNQFVFKLEQKEYEKEKIKWSFIDFPDNQKCLDLIEGKPLGIIALLDEQCLLKGTDKSLASQLYEKLSSVERFAVSNKQKVRHEFTIEHYAGDVIYETDGFIVKNKDQLHQEALDAMQTSSIEFLQILFPKGESNNANSGKKGAAAGARSLQSKTLGSQFKEQLANLLKTIRSTSPHYVRCLKPNDKARSGLLVRGRLVDQLRYGGVLEAVKVARAGYPVRMELPKFVTRYFILMKQMDVQKARTEHDGRHATAEIVEVLKLEPDFEYQIGRTKIFLRKGAYEKIEEERILKMKISAIRIQSILRGAKLWKEYQAIFHAVRNLQRVSRGMLGRSKARHVRRTNAATRVQAIVRMGKARLDLKCMIHGFRSFQEEFRLHRARLHEKKAKRDHAIFLLQAWLRALPARNRFLEQRNLTIKLQTLARGKLARSELKQLKIEAREVGTLQSKIDELKGRVTELEGELASEKEAHEALKSASSVGAVTKAEVASAELEDLRKQLKNANLKTSMQSEEIKLAEDVSKDLERQLHEKDDLIQQLQQQVASIEMQQQQPVEESEFAVDDDRVVSLEEKLLKLQEDLDDERNTKKVNGDLDTGVTVVAAAGTAVKSGSPSAETEVNQQDGDEFAQQKREIEKLTIRVKELEAELAFRDAQDENATIQDESERNEEKVLSGDAFGTEDFQVLQEQLRNTIERMCEAENRYNEAHAEVVRLRRTNQDLVEKHSAMEQLNTQSSSVKIKLARRLQALILENRTLRTEKDELDQENARMQQENMLLRAPRRS